MGARLFPGFQNSVLAQKSTPGHLWGGENVRDRAENRGESEKRSKKLNKKQTDNSINKIYKYLETSHRLPSDSSNHEPDGSCS